MRREHTCKKAAILAMTGILASSALCGISTKVYASDGMGIYAESGMTLEDKAATAVVTASTAYVHEGAGNSYRILNTLTRGDKFRITGQVLRDGEKTGWYRLEIEDKTYGDWCQGYIHESAIYIIQ